MLHVMTPTDYLLTVINFQMLLQKKKKIFVIKKKNEWKLKV